MRRARCLFAAGCLFSGAAAAQAQQPQAPQVLESSPASLSQAQVDDLLRVLNDAALTHLEAKVSVEKVEVRGGRVRLRGVHLRDVRLGLSLRARGTRALLESLAARSPRSEELAAILGVVQLGIYNSLDIGLRLKSLGLRELSLDADALKVDGLAAWANARLGRSEETIRLDGSAGAPALTSLAHLLSKASVSRAETGLSLPALNARALKLSLNGLSLEELWVGFDLRRSN